jgi:hypothetical protein
MGTPLENLKRQFPIFVIKNKTAMPKELLIAGGETVHIPAFGVRKIASSNIIQIPDSVFFECISPSVDDLILFNVITREDKTGKKEMKETK